MGSSSDVTGVIVADDDSLIRDILRNKIEALDQTVFLAADGAEAVELASRIKAKLIVLDLNMPRMNGLLACEQIRQLPHNATTPIVILTVHDVKDAKAAARRVGATAFLTKPFRMGPLLEVLTRYLPIDDATRAAIRSSADRAGEIALSRMASAPGKEVEAGSSHHLDRGKDILQILRG